MHQRIQSRDSDRQTPASDGQQTGLDVRSQGQHGNAFRAQQLSERASSCDPPQDQNPDAPWYAYPTADAPNLRGNHPVKNRETPPNKGIIEDQPTYNTRMSAAKNSLGVQRARADSLWTDQVHDNRYWFSRVYQFVTQGEIDQASSSGFYYPSFVLASVLYFENVYENNFEAWSGGRHEDVEAHWQEAFQTCVDNEDSIWDDLGEAGLGGALGGFAGGLLGIPLPGAVFGAAAAWATDEVLSAVRSLVVSMQAHIRYDLPRCEAWVFSQYYSGMENATLGNFQPDFMAMGGIFDRAGAQMNSDIADKLGMPVDWAPPGLQDWAMTYLFDADMTTERNDTWMRAQALVDGGLANNSPYAIDGQGNVHGDVTAPGADHLSPMQQLPERLRPSMDESAEVLDDNAVRAEAGSEVIENPCGDPTIESLKQKGTSERIDMIRGCIRGFTGDADEASILNLLEASRQSGDLNTVIAGARAHELASNTHGAEWATLRDRYFRPLFYRTAANHLVLELLMTCMRGYTGGWEEDMIVDIISARSTSSRSWIVEQIGQHIGEEEVASAQYQQGVEELRDEIGDRLDGVL